MAADHGVKVWRIRRTGGLTRFVRSTRAGIGACLVLLMSMLTCAAQSLSMEDAIRMSRIQSWLVTPDGSMAAISSDGRKAAVVTWCGDIEKNTNVYTLKVIDLSKNPFEKPKDLLSIEFAGDQKDQNASPISQIKFLPTGDGLTFLGRMDDGMAQVYVVDLASGKVRQLSGHPNAVRSYITDSSGRLLAFSAVAKPEVDKVETRLSEDGVFLWDETLRFRRFGSFRSWWPIIRHGETPKLFRQYFLANGGKAKLIFDSRSSRLANPPDFSDPKVSKSIDLGLEDEEALEGWATLTGDPKGKRMLLFPYGLTNHPMRPERYAYYADSRQNPYSRRVAAPYGLVDLTSGRIDRLIDAPAPQFEMESGTPLWSPDGETVIVYTLLPNAPEQPPQWAEVDIGTRAITPLSLPKGWKPIRWAPDGNSVVVSERDRRFARVSRQLGTASWGNLEELGSVSGFNGLWSVATNGEVALGVKENTYSPPEVAAYDLATGSTSVLTDLNPFLRKRSYAQTELIKWKSPYQEDASGYLIRPMNYIPGKRYPLVILLDDGQLSAVDLKHPYLLDSAGQLSGYAIQMLATQGFIILYPREPPLRGVFGTPEEGLRVKGHLESVIEKLDKEGLIDPDRIGLSGWSRAGYHTDYMLMNSKVKFAAASVIDTGSSDYADGLRPYSDEEMRRINTPKLFEAHGESSLALMAPMADRMNFLGGSADVLYFHTASHSTTRPQHRLRSLSTHMDWWRFWLKDEEDPSPEKEEQYKHWRQLREMHGVRRVGYLCVSGT